MARPHPVVTLVPGEARLVREPSSPVAVGWLCLCARCSWVWLARKNKPAACAGCKDIHWRSVAGTMRRGRPPRAKPAA